MSNWVKDLDVEYENALIRFDLSKLTLIADLDNKSIPLSQMGSGANWVINTFRFTSTFYSDEQASTSFSYY